MKVLITTLFAACTVCVDAQTELNGRFSSLRSADMAPIGRTPLLHLDSARFKIDMNRLDIELKPHYKPIINDYTQLPISGIMGKNLWAGASVGFYGQSSQLLGLMNSESSSISLNQDIGRLHLVASVHANKYWMPWQNKLNSQFGFGVMLSYHLNPSVSLHSFGYYYANNMHVGPAMSPYVNNTKYGAYADIRFSKNFGANLGINRYINPINGKWTTVPIVTPYIKIGNFILEISLGDLLKAFVFGSRDNPMQFYQMPPSRVENPINTQAFNLIKN